MLQCPQIIEVGWSRGSLVIIIVVVVVVVVDILLVVVSCAGGQENGIVPTFLATNAAERFHKGQAQGLRRSRRLSTSTSTSTSRKGQRRRRGGGRRRQRHVVKGETGLLVVGTRRGTVGGFRLVWRRGSRCGCAAPSKSVDGRSSGHDLPVLRRNDVDAISRVSREEEEKNFESNRL